MAFNPENHDPSEVPEVDPQLHSQAERISNLVYYVLDNAKPTWDDTTLFYQSPVGPDHRMEVETRAYRMRDRLDDGRKFGILHKESTRSILVSPLMVNLNYLPEKPVIVRPYEADQVAELLNEDMEDDVRELILDAERLHADVADQSIIDSINTRMATLLEKGMVYRGKGFMRYETVTGDKVSLMVNAKEGDEPWPRVDEKPLMQIQVEFDGQAIDLIHENGSDEYETFDADPDTARRLRATAGDDHVIELGDDAVAIFDDGSMDRNEAVLKAAERAMGLRALTAHHLDRIEMAMKQVAAEVL